jgi:Prokaryotic E2 family D
MTSSLPFLLALPDSVDVSLDPLRLRLDFHEESVVLQEFGRATIRTRLVSALDVAHALASELDLSSGVLPPDAIWWGRSSGGESLALFREARVWIVRVRRDLTEKPRRLHLPMPPLVFVCRAGEKAPSVFAAKARPKSLEDPLYHCPTYNVFDSGVVCAGSHVFPKDPAKVPESFFESFFHADLGTGRGKSVRHPDDVGLLWDEIEGEASFPLEDLVPQGQLGELLKGERPR